MNTNTEETPEVETETNDVETSKTTSFKSGYDRGELNKSGYNREPLNKYGYDRGPLNKSGYETKAGGAMANWEFSKKETDDNEGEEKDSDSETNMNENKKTKKKDVSFAKNGTRLPQITAPFYFIAQNLDDLGVDYEPVNVKVDALQGGQDDVMMEKIDAMVEKISMGQEFPPIYISSDYHICDGHHRVAAKMVSHGKSSRIKAIKIMRPFVEVPHLMGRIQDRWDMITNYPEYDDHFTKDVNLENKSYSQLTNRFAK